MEVFCDYGFALPLVVPDLNMKIISNILGEIVPCPCLRGNNLCDLSGRRSPMAESKYNRLSKAVTNTLSFYCHADITLLLGPASKSLALIMRSILSDPHGQFQIKMGIAFDEIMEGAHSCSVRTLSSSGASSVVDSQKAAGIEEC